MLLVLGPALHLPLPASAQLTECPSIARTAGAKVVVGDVRPVDGDAAALSQLDALRLQNAIRQQISQLNAERPAEVRAVICQHRWPEAPEVFTLSLTRNLLDQDVLIELWGVIEHELALINYAVLPVRVRGERQLPGVYPLVYSMAQGGIPAVFRDARELKAFSALALGFRSLESARAAQAAGRTDQHLRSARLNDARSYFCAAVRLLGEAGAANSELGPELDQWKALISLATQSAAEVVQLARADPDYVGTLKLVPEDLLDSCQPGVS